MFADTFISLTSSLFSSLAAAVAFIGVAITATGAARAILRATSDLKEGRLRSELYPQEASYREVDEDGNSSTASQPKSAGGSQGPSATTATSSLPATPIVPTVPRFEITALESYYRQALSRAQISFWFSLVFAAIGFGVIIFAFISHSPGDWVGTVIKVMSGTIIDAVSSLFFIQSTNAQKAMADFFEKLRLDRLNAEARDMIRDIEDVAMRDQLRGQLILKYSGIEQLLAGSTRPAP